ncbi:TPA: hypothetical protein PIO13_001935 [Klebsiella pneumoniae]|nr:hypothetical protein [Klebsiella pneumoniae]
MSPEDFIRKHIIAALEADLLPSDAIRGGVERALDYYRRMSQASRKGAAFDDCLHLAKQWALGQTPIAERKARKKSSRNIQHGLF